MLKLLVKKQLAEMFRGYVYDPKKNRARSRGGMITLFVLFGFLMVVVLGGAFAAVAIGLGSAFLPLGLGWLYYTIMGFMAVLLGCFGSVFNTYSGLYLARDNDLILSLPIPVGAVIAARLTGVYLMGLLYSATVSVPAVIVYWVLGPHGILAVLGGLLFIFLLSVVVTLLSCLLGWVVAQVSVKLKSKSMITVLAALLGFAAYYLFYFKAQVFLRDLAQNAAVYGPAIREKASLLYFLGRAGEGAPGPLLASAGIVALCTLLCWKLLSRSFLPLAAGSGSASRTAGKRRVEKPRTLPAALFARELSRLAASPSYMLNCGLGTLLIVIAGVLLLLKGQAWLAPATALLGAPVMTVLLGAGLCMLISTNDLTAPSVSLEGKTLWLLQSLPISPRRALWAKLELHLVLTGIPALFSWGCVCIVLRPGVPGGLMLLLLTLAHVAFSGALGLALGTRLPNLSWTREIVAVKQGLPVMLTLFGGWLYALLLGGGYLLLAGHLGPVLYLSLWAAVTAVGAALLLRWIFTSGARRLAQL